MYNDKLKLILKDYGADVDAINERFIGDMDFYSACLKEFISDDSMKNIEQAIKLGQYKTAFEAAHMLKGISANMGLIPLCEATSNIVELLRAQEFDNLYIAFKQLTSEYARCKEMISNCELERTPAL